MSLAFRLPSPAAAAPHQQPIGPQPRRHSCLARQRQDQRSRHPDLQPSAVQRLTPHRSVHRANSTLASDPAGWNAGEAGLGQFTETFTFTNTSHMTCELGGWPGLQAMVDGIAQPTTAPRVRQNSPSAPAWSPVTLAPGATAAFDVYGQDFDAASNRACGQTTSGFLVIPPGGTTQMIVTAAEPDCSSTFYVAPVIAGSVDRLAWSTVVSG